MADLYPDYRYLGVIPVVELPDYLIGNHDSAPAAFVTSFTAVGGLKVSPQLVSKIAGKRPNPGKTGRTDYCRRDPLRGNAQETTAVVLKESQHQSVVMGVT